VKNKLYTFHILWCNL